MHTANKSLKSNSCDLHVGSQPTYRGTELQLTWLTIYRSRLQAPFIKGISNQLEASVSPCHTKAAGRVLGLRTSQFNHATKGVAEPFTIARKTNLSRQYSCRLYLFSQTTKSIWWPTTLKSEGIFILPTNCSQYHRLQSAGRTNLELRTRKIIRSECGQCLSFSGSTEEHRQKDNCAERGKKAQFFI